MSINSVNILSATISRSGYQRNRLNNLETSISRLPFKSDSFFKDYLAIGHLLYEYFVRQSVSKNIETSNSLLLYKIKV